MWQTADFVFRTRRAGAVRIGTRTKQSFRWIGARVASAFARDMGSIARRNIVAYPGVIGAVFAFDQIKPPHEPARPNSPAQSFERFFFLLQGPHVRVHAAVIEQFAVTAALDYAAMIHHQDFVGIDDRR